MRVLIADDHDLLRDTLVMFLENEGSMETAAVGTSAQAVERIEKPDSPGPKGLLCFGFCVTWS